MQKIGAETEAHGAVAYSNSEAVLARAEAILNDRIQKALEAYEHSQAASSKTKDALLRVIQAALFETGLLEKIIQRAVDQKLKSASGSRAGGAANGEGTLAAVKDYLAQNLPPLCQSEIQAVVQKEVQAAFAGEKVKEMLEEKFRAMSIYLKTDVVPKAIALHLKQTTQ